jgi:hypothetical protein
VVLKEKEKESHTEKESVTFTMAGLYWERERHERVPLPSE